MYQLKGEVYQDKKQVQFLMGSKMFWIWIEACNNLHRGQIKREH